MKTETFFTIVLALALIGICTGCARAGWGVVRGSGNVVEQDHAVAGVTGVNLATIGDLHIALGDQEGLRIQAEDNLLPYFEFILAGGRLEIHSRNGVLLRPTRPVNFYLTVKALDSVGLTGSGNIYAPDLSARQFDIRSLGSGDITVGRVDAEALDVHMMGSGRLQAAGFKARETKVTLGGSGDLRLGTWEADTVEARLTGSGSLEVSGGQVQKQHVTLSGAGDYIARDLAGADVDARIIGSGSMTVRAQDTLAGHISGSGSINYIGAPKVQVTVTGSGRVQPASF